MEVNSMVVGWVWITAGLIMAGISYNVVRYYFMRY